MDEPLLIEVSDVELDVESDVRVDSLLAEVSELEVELLSEFVGDE